MEWEQPQSAASAAWAASESHTGSSVTEAALGSHDSPQASFTGSTAACSSNASAPLFSNLFSHYSDSTIAAKASGGDENPPPNDLYPSIKGDRDLFFQYLNELKSRIQKLKEKQEKIEKRRERRISKNKKTLKQDRQLGEISEKTCRLDEALAELEVLGNSEQEYYVGTYKPNPGSREAGRTQFDKKTQQVQVLISDASDLDATLMQRLGHELKHAYQFETGQESLTYNGGMGGHLHDIEDEVEAYKRSQDLGFAPGETINADWVRRRGRETSEAVDPLAKDNYQFSPEHSQPISMQTPFGMSTYGDGLRANVKSAGKHGNEPFEVFKGWKKVYDEGVAERNGP